MPRKIVADGGELVLEDFDVISAALELELYDRVLFHMMGNQENFCFGNSFKVAYASGTSVTVEPGTGFQTDEDQEDPEPQKRLLYLAAQATKTLSTPDATNPRIDIVCIKHNRAVTDTDTRKYKDLLGNISNTTQDIESDWASDVLVVAGTPAGSPSAPATPAGYIKIAELAVSASTGLSGSSAVTDSRVLYKRPSGWRNTVSKVAAYTASKDDDVIFCNGTFTVTFPAAADCLGKELQIVNIGSGVITEDGNASEQVAGATTQTCEAGSAHKYICDGTAWYLIA